MTDVAADRKTLWYVCLEALTEGQASHAHVMGIVNGLRRRGWEVTLFHPAAKPGHHRGALRRLFDEMLLQAKAMVRRRPPAVLYVRGHFLSLPVVVWARVRRVLVVWESNGARTDILSSWPMLRPVLPVLDLLGEAQLRLATAAIGVTPELAEACKRSGARRAFVVPNGADTDLFAPTATTSAILPGRFVSFTGNLATWQGIETLLAAVDSRSWPPDVGLVVMGDGVLADLVAERAARNPRIDYRGRVPHREVPGIMAHALAALVTVARTQRTATGVVPLKLFEAMGTRVPVIVTDLPGQADIVTEHRCGYVIPPDDPQALAEAVWRMSVDPERDQMGDRGRAAAAKHYSWDTAAATTDRIIQSLLD
jgi:glycosyltransferase involved in cell wall biosynthesis